MKRSSRSFWVREINRFEACALYFLIQTLVILSFFLKQYLTFGFSFGKIYNICAASFLRLRCAAARTCGLSHSSILRRSASQLRERMERAERRQDRAEGFPSCLLFCVAKQRQSLTKAE